MIKYCFSLIIFILSQLFLCLPQLTAEEINSSFLNSTRAEQTKPDVYDNMLNSFKLLSSLFHDMYQQDNYIIPVHGNNIPELIDYLAAGFETELAANIIDTYIQWIPELNKPVIIPCDSIPIITNSDKEKLNYYYDNNGNFLFYRYYTDCYNPGDRYYYEVSLHFTGNRWKVNSIKLETLVE